MKITNLHKQQNHKNLEAIISKCITFFELENKNIELVLANNKNDHSRFRKKKIQDSFGLFFPTKDGVEELAPENIVKATQSKNNDYVVWIKHDAITKSEIFFSWILAHEFRHIKQRIEYPNIMKCRLKLEEKFIISKTNYNQHGIPCELDADIYARDFCYKVFGKFKTHQFIKELIQLGIREKSFNDIINQRPCDLNKRYTLHLGQAYWSKTTISF